MVSHIKLYDKTFFRSWEAFVDRLKETYSDGPVPEDPKDTILLRQLRFSIALGAIGQLLEDRKERELAAEFHSLSIAFTDLAEEGVVNPLFASQKKSKRGRSKDSSELWVMRSSVVIGIKFMLAGELEEDAAYKVALKYRKGLSGLLRPGAELKSSIKTWVESFEAEKVRNEIAVDAYKDGVERLELLKQGFLNEVLRHIGEGLIKSIAARASSRLPRRI
ncbi:hypothetical protein [Bradyrhizobium sp. AZCC 1708]|uniref:hypothetical protein n=1 Tax=Bradyrhizobium sp. AZCC 1708 TaxID=3117015 RepID=UPI002FF0462A